jgi:predicted PurR-regulated permease PerM
MSFPDGRTTYVLLTIAFFALACAIIYSARRIPLILVSLGVVKSLSGLYLLPTHHGAQFSIHPFAAIFAILVGAEVGGIVGVYPRFH